MRETGAKVPKGWDREAHQHWLAGRRADALTGLMRLLDSPADSAELALQIGYYLFLDGAYGPARGILEQAAERHRDHPVLLLNVAVVQSRTGGHAQARATLERYLELGGAETAAFDGLCAACHKLGDDEAARGWGRKAIEEKSRIAADHAPAFALGAPRKSGKNVISFGLWGNHPRYLRGALHNAVRAWAIYPDFKCRFYIDSSVPPDLLAALDQASSELVIEDGEPAVRHRLTRRFLVADDPGVACYLIRDCDSLINPREAGAVKAWLASGKPFHVMRDWWTHTDPILAGMWGGIGGVLPPLAPMIEGYRSREIETPNWDQWFLRDRIWTSIRDVSLVHDRLFGTAGSEPFPGTQPQGNYHVGQNEFAVRKEEQARELAPFKENVPSLAL
jgi:tetratricopeptide (TPR) repeat protein